MWWSFSAPSDRVTTRSSQRTSSAETPFTVRDIRAASAGNTPRVLQWDSIKTHSNVAVHRGWWPAEDRGYRQYIASLPGNYNLVWGLSSVRQEEWSALPLPHTRKLISGILARGERGGIGGVVPYLSWLNAGLRDQSETPGFPEPHSAGNGSNATISG